MQRYAPHAKDLAGRDVVSRALTMEIKEGRGCGKDADHLLLKLDHLGADVINMRLPGIREIAIKFAQVDPINEPIPVVPTAHYMMGGIPTNFHGQVVAPYKTGPEEVVRGFTRWVSVLVFLCMVQTAWEPIHCSTSLYLDELLVIRLLKI